MRVRDFADLNGLTKQQSLAASVWARDPSPDRCDNAAGGWTQFNFIVDIHGICDTNWKYGNRSCLTHKCGHLCRSSGRHDVSRRWAAAAQQLSLSEDQREKMLAVRLEHLRRLQHIYSERHVANLEAIGVLVRL